MLSGRYTHLLSWIVGLVFVEVIQKHLEETRVRQVAGQFETGVSQIEQDVQTRQVAFDCVRVSVDSDRLQVSQVLADSASTAQVNEAVPQHLQMATSAFATLNQFRDAV